MSSNEQSIIDTLKQSLNKADAEACECGESHEAEPKMTPEEELAATKQAIENAPESYLDAVKRIMEVEMRLEDLSRAVEIAEITGQINLVEGFRKAADESLEKKITMKRENTGDLNITVVTGELDPSSLQKPQAM